MKNKLLGASMGELKEKGASMESITIIQMEDSSMDWETVLQTENLRWPGRLKSIGFGDGHGV